MNIGTAQVIRANSRHLPLADNSVDLVVTSPPYFALRSYQDGGSHYAGQIGDEPTPAEFVDSLLEVTRECVRVLKPSGSLWVNLGDKYAGSNGQAGGGGKSTLQNPSANGRERGNYDALKGRGFVAGGAPTKSLIGIPWRYALRCIDDLGLILRAEVIWSKPNGLPESVTDRVRRSHETWFHFTLSPRYFSAVDNLRVKYEGDRALSRRVKHPGDGKHSQRAAWASEHDLGALPGSVWTVPTEPLRVPADLGIDHFAAFPTEWPKRIIRGWSPDPEECRCCGAAPEEDETCGDCGCSTTSVVLDPFGGTGTTAMVAKALGRHGISVDMSSDYGRLAQWRVNDLDQLAKVQGIKRSDAAKAADDLDMDSLFDLGEPA